MLCSVCNKNTAIIFINKQDNNGNSSLEGFCYNCAKEKGINPLDVLAKQSSILDGDKINLEDMTSQFETIFKDITENLSNQDISLDGASATGIPFNALFSVSQANSNDLSNTTPSSSSNSTKKVKVEKKSKQKKMKFLDTYGTNLTSKAKNNELDIVIGRDREIRKNDSNSKSSF